MTCLQPGCNSKSSYKKNYCMSPNIFRAPTTRTLRAALAALVAAILCLLPGVRPAHAALPPVAGLPLVYKIQTATFAAIIASTLAQVLSSRSLRASSDKRATHLDTAAAFLILTLYLGYIALLLFTATMQAASLP